MGEWQPIDTAPVDKVILVYGYDDYEKRVIIATAYNTRGIAPAGNHYSRWDSFGCYSWEEEELACNPTHWMPLPEAPNAP